VAGTGNEEMRMSLRRGILAALAVTAALGIAACGEGQSKEIEEVRTAVEEILGSADPERCQRFSPEVLEQTTGQTGQKAVRACEQQTEGTEPPEQVTAAAIEVDGGTATSNFNNGQTAGRLELEKVDGEWIITGLSFGINQPAEGAGEGEGAEGDGGGSSDGEGAGDSGDEGPGSGYGGP
jgi:hypothetical protein